MTAHCGQLPGLFSPFSRRKKNWAAFFSQLNCVSPTDTYNISELALPLSIKALIIYCVVVVAASTIFNDWPQQSKENRKWGLGIVCNITTQRVYVSYVVHRYVQKKIAFTESILPTMKLMLRYRTSQGSLGVQENVATFES